MCIRFLDRLVETQFQLPLAMWWNSLDRPGPNVIEAYRSRRSCTTPLDFDNLHGPRESLTAPCNAISHGSNPGAKISRARQRRCCSAEFCSSASWLNLEASGQGTALWAKMDQLKHDWNNNKNWQMDINGFNHWVLLINYNHEIMITQSL